MNNQPISNDTACVLTAGEPLQFPLPLTAMPMKSWVHEVLEPDQLSTSRKPYGRRPLGLPTLLLLWALRVYVLLMIVIVVLVVHNALLAGS